MKLFYGKIFILCIINNLIVLKNSKQKVITLTINQLQITRKITQRF